MKRNPFFIILFTTLGLLCSAVHAQDNNYLASKYDFIPGEKIIFFDDFTTESVGDFPAQWLTNGSGEIVTSPKFPGRWFQITKGGYIIPEAREDFTDNYTIEFDLVPMNTASSETLMGTAFYLLSGSLDEPGGGGEPGHAGLVLSPDYDNIFWKNWSEANDQRYDGMVSYLFKTNEKYHISFWIQKQRIRLYANESKVLDLPRGLPAGFNYNIFRIETLNESIPIIANFRIAAGLPDLRNKLLKEGKIVSYGITFDVNSDKLKPESYSTLKEIADVVKENPGMRLQIVGHTDSDGDEVSNLDLSKRRAASVKNELLSKFTLEGSRLETDGKGESVPIADNTSAVNKAKNRRVEFINIKNRYESLAGAKSLTALGAGSFIDARDSKNYKTITLGSQTWMAENLGYKANSGCWAYDNKQSNLTTYGYLYNWETAKGVCPSGWHLPTDTEWTMLTDFLGGESLAGGRLKESDMTHWNSPNTGATNTSGFAALPGGGRTYDGKFDVIRKYGYWWSSTEADDTISAWHKAMFNNNSEARRFRSIKANGFSVRCVKDELNK
ncbi:MAG: FISUMP domain-containing protein [Bacteroidota bacterium]